ncbi:peptidoglycan-binding domain-containing protein [Lichenifustis flavocetrariae]|uniref:Peptidoglycan-binding protein n=1 Tax=Lichenifustis flavocetrariae TaxID=2949735 RepID=A0AA42CN50_9HYPH|nr:peptidoglycan-binding domain-containing protein [Lichenifustis flavocetrariae]MCW6512346.1 peptidoglycan-binding protein [Lichenifustis flavocetrariae]
MLDFPSIYILNWELAMPRDLSIGMAGEDVRALQNLLNYHLDQKLAPLVADGKFGSATRERTIEFQKRNKYLPPCLPYAADYARQFRSILKVDGIVGQHTLHVLLDARTIATPTSDPPTFTPVESTSPIQRLRTDPNLRSRFGGKTSAVGDPPGPTPNPSPSPPVSPRTFHFIQLQQGSSAAVNPWSFSPFSMAAQVVVLAKNEGKPDFLFTAGGQASLNDGNPQANGRWTGQGFLQIGLGFNQTLKLFGRTLDLANPFVQAMISKNLKARDPAATAGLAIGNQISWKLIERRLPGAQTDDDTQDTVSVFFNGQIVSNTALTNGRTAAPSGSAMLGLTYTFGFF